MNVQGLRTVLSNSTSIIVTDPVAHVNVVLDPPPPTEVAWESFSFSDYLKVQQQQHK